MKIDIGRGKILGTKTVSSNGQISGFTEYAGQEVLVVLPEEGTEVEPEAREIVEEITLATREQMKQAFREYEELKRRFEGPSEATREFLDENAPGSFRGLYDRIEHWVQSQANQAEDRVKEAIDYEEAPASEDPDEPTDESSRSSSPTPPEGTS